MATSSSCATCNGKNLHRSFLLFVGTTVVYLWYQNWVFEQHRMELVRKRLGSNQVLATTVIAETVATQYNVGKPVSCKLIRAGFNHNYICEMDDEPRTKYVLRVYLNGKYYIQSPDDFRMELDLVHYLVTEHNIPTVKPIPSNTGDWLSQIHFNGEGQQNLEQATGGSESSSSSLFLRYAALFEFAPGVEASEIKLTPAHFTIIGELQARIHHAVDQYTNPHNYHRYHQDVSTYLLDKPLEFLERALSRCEPMKHHNLDFFQPTAQAMRDMMTDTSITKEKPFYGYIHGDLHPGNLFWDDATQTFTVIDWDHSSYGWRVYDAVALIHPSKLPFFIAGYERVRALTPEEKRIIPLMKMLREVWDMGDILAFQPLWEEDPTQEEMRQQLEENLERLRKIVKSFKETYGNTAS